MVSYCTPLPYRRGLTREEYKEVFLSRLAHTYQQGQNIRAVISAYLDPMYDADVATQSMLDFFSIDTATGDQLDALGYLLGLPRTVCNVARVGDQTVCVPDETYTLQDYTMSDDNEYRRFLLALTYSQGFDGTLKQFERIAQYLWDGIDFDDATDVGDTRVLSHGGGLVTIAVNRDLTTNEQTIVELYKYVLPYFGAYGIKVFAGTDFFRFNKLNPTTTGLCQPFGRAY